MQVDQNSMQAHLSTLKKSSPPFKNLPLKEGYKLFPDVSNLWVVHKGIRFLNRCFGTDMTSAIFYQLLNSTYNHNGTQKLWDLLGSPHMTVEGSPMVHSACL